MQPCASSAPSGQDRKDATFSTGCAPSACRRTPLHPWLATTLRPVGAKNAKRWQSGCEPGKKCRLQIDHVIPISQGGTDEEGNLRAVCVYYNKDKADVIRPASGQAISALASIRKLPRSVQEEVYRFLAAKFGKSE